MKRLLFLLLVLALASGCVQNRMRLPEPPQAPPAPREPDLNYADTKKHGYRARQPVPVNESRYEGSLWEDEASWGNLLRDHRARFTNDVLTIVDLEEIISIPKKEKPEAKRPAPPATGAAAQGEAAAAQVNKVLDVAAKVTGEDKVEEEQNEVLSSLKTISARVTSVLPNGNMVVVGEKVDYRQQNTVRYVTKIQGIIRPEDVTDKNEITAVRLARSEVQIKRQVLAKSLKLNALSPLIGQQKAGVLDRLSHLATPTPTNRTNKVTTK